MGPIVLTQLATGLSVLAGAVLVKSVLKNNSMGGPGGLPRCPSCNGTGRVTCTCTRWSDGDVGCRTCAGSGRMACNSCGGTGTGRAIPVQISVRPSNRTSWRWSLRNLVMFPIPCTLFRYIFIVIILNLHYVISVCILEENDEELLFRI